MNVGEIQIFYYYYLYYSLYSYDFTATSEVKTHALI